jgi:hypothetical protein
MIASAFCNVLGLFVEVLGGGMCIWSLVITSPEIIADALRDIHGNRLRARNLDSNRFLDGLVRQSFEAQGGFATIIFGAVIQAIPSLFPCLQTYHVSKTVALITGIAVLSMIFSALRRINNWRRNRARARLLNKEK